MPTNSSELPLQSLYQRTPLVLAHGGASYEAPANTLSAFRLAWQMGTDGIALNTSLTADGVPVVIQDFVVDETTDGTGRVRDYTLHAIKKLDAGSYFDHSFKDERIPTLEEALNVIGQDVLVNIELKSTDMRGQGLEQAVLNVIQQTRKLSRVLVSSFNPLALRRFHRLAPQIPLGYLYAPDSPAYFRLLLTGLPIPALHPQHDSLDKTIVAALRRRHRVNAWTVDNPIRIRVLRDFGVDGIITTRPDVVVAALGRFGFGARMTIA